ncbi:hypothetical protein ACQEVC_35340 [Plantactinospora sp. CA-294935]|uniref:hypothetical protein n=1 Tax=Plantactinospora sp. CA-294935 TaxID=3240012 RepID=UPI003D911A8C
MFDPPPHPRQLPGVRWERTAQGLHLPAVDRTTGVEPSPEMLAAARAQARAATIGAVVAGVAMLISAAALVVSADAWRQQRVLNEQQAELNDYARLREQRVYSSRVTLLARAGETNSSVLPDGLDVSVQNRAPVPLQQVRVLGPLTGTPGLVGDDLGTVAPCTIVTFRLAPPDGRVFADDPENPLVYTRLSLVFTETGQHWRLDGDGLTRLDAAPSAPPGPTPTIHNQLEQPAGDCGEAR